MLSTFWTVQESVGEIKCASSDWRRKILYRKICKKFDEKFNVKIPVILIQTKFQMSVIFNELGYG